MEAEEKLREQIANKIKPHMGAMCPPGRITGIIGCPDYAQKAQDGIESCKYCVADQILNLIKEASYLLVEPVQLEVLGDEEIKETAKYVPTKEEWVIKPEHRYWQDKAISQATITHNEAKGQLYRRIDNADSK